MRINGLWLRPAMPCKLPARSCSFSPRAECSAALSRGCPVRRQNQRCDVLAPLIAQLEFRENHVQRVVALAVAVAQAAYALRPRPLVWSGNSPRTQQAQPRPRLRACLSLPRLLKDWQLAHFCWVETDYARFLSRRSGRQGHGGLGREQ